MNDKNHEVRHFQFVVVDIQQATSDDTGTLVSKIVDCFDRHQAMTAVISSFLIVGCLGLPDSEYDSPQGRMALVAELLVENPGELRIAHGECNGIVAVIANRHTELIPGFPEIREKLAAAPVNSVLEVL